VHEAVERGGKVLIPTTSLGKCQELQLLLDAYWQVRSAANSSDRAAVRPPCLCPQRMGLSAPIYLSASMVSKANLYYKLFTAWTSTDMQARARTRRSR